MSQLTPRPRFQELLPDSSQEVIARLQDCFVRPDSLAIGEVVAHHIYLKIPPQDRHYWSPQLDLELEEQEGGGTLLRGLVGPSASVWTKFIFLYSAGGFFSMIGLIVTLSQWTLGKSLSGLWVLGISVLVLLGTYLMAQTGRKIAHDQTWQLRHFLDECLNLHTTTNNSR